MKHHSNGVVISTGAFRALKSTCNLPEADREYVARLALRMLAPAARKRVLASLDSEQPLTNIERRFVETALAAEPRQQNKVALAKAQAHEELTRAAEVRKINAERQLACIEAEIEALPQRRKVEALAELKKAEAELKALKP